MLDRSKVISSTSQRNFFLILLRTATTVLLLVPLTTATIDPLRQQVERLLTIVYNSPSDRAVSSIHNDLPIFSFIKI